MDNDEYYKNMIERLLSKFPEFASSEERKEVYENDGPYTYMSYFGDFLLNKIEEDANSEFVQRTFDFINTSFEDPNINTKIWDLLNLELYERFEMESKYKSVALKYLKGKALLAFKEKKGRPE
jgi:hypothetical protein